MATRKKITAAQAPEQTEAGKRIDALLDELEAALAAGAGAGDNVALRVARYNRMVEMAAAHTGMPHPALAPQLVPVEDVEGNDYNPNKVAPPEMRLLKQITGLAEAFADREFSRAWE